MRFIAVVLLGVIDLLHPVPIFVVVQRMLVFFRVDRLSEALERLKELERLEERAKRFEHFSPEAAKAELIFRIRFELIACARSIRYQRSRPDEAEPGWLEEDFDEFFALVEQRAQLMQLEPVFVRSTFLDMIRQHVKEADERFERAFDAYYA